MRNGYGVIDGFEHAGVGGVLQGRRPAQAEHGQTAGDKQDDDADRDQPADETARWRAPDPMRPARPYFGRRGRR